MTWTEIPEEKIEGHGLGRHIHRPAGFEARTFGAVSETDIPIVSVTHTRHCPPFDQGSLGSCVGNASAGALMTDNLFVTGRAFTEATAVQIYSEATHFNGTPGDYYPPNDTGSSGPAAGQALEAFGLISTYQHATDLQASLQGLMSGPAIFGVSWYSSFDTPLSTGECPLSSSATVRGGHEIEAFQVDVTNERVWFYQSWGTTWGGLGNGTFWLSYATLNSLFAEQADATFFTGTQNVNPVVPTPNVSTSGCKSVVSRLSHWFRSL